MIIMFLLKILNFKHFLDMYYTFLNEIFKILNYFINTSDITQDQ